MIHSLLRNTHVSCQLYGMIFASRSNFDAETALRRLEDRVNTIQQAVDLLRDSTDTRIVNLQSEWRQYLAAMEDTLDKLDHISKRQAKRRTRQKDPQGDPAVGAEPTETPTPDPITAKIQARRQHAVRPTNVQG
jgi:two-component sensor histidine kinase